MKKYYYLLVLILILGLCVGCKDVPNATYGNSGENRFIFTGQQFYVGGQGSFLCVIKDTKTNILYLDNSVNYGGLTPWLDADGKPIKE